MEDWTHKFFVKRLCAFEFLSVGLGPFSRSGGQNFTEGETYKGLFLSRSLRSRGQTTERNLKAQSHVIKN